ncbi:MAG: helicase-related protein, partial [Acidimicrobiales bacterium]
MEHRTGDPLHRVPDHPALPPTALGGPGTGRRAPRPLVRRHGRRRPRADQRRVPAPPRLRPVRILLATDAASEGIDLQRHCHRLVHVEIPFSPTRLDQRNGRIDRHGQPSSEVLIHHFVGAGWEHATPERWRGVARGPQEA